MAAAFLFYRSAWALVLIVPAVIACVCRGRTRREQEQIKRLQRQFQSAMQSVSGTLGAGYSLEYAWRYAQGDMAAVVWEGCGYCAGVCIHEPENTNE